MGALRVTLLRAMNPDKLFDYLDGNLPAHERAELEAQLARDAELQRELAIAREIHRGMRNRLSSREVFPPLEELEQQRGAKIGRAVAVAFAVLVFVNVLIGIAFIVGLHKPRKSPPPNVQQQIATSVQKAAESALPAPTLSSDDIVLFAPASEQESAANKIIAVANDFGGSATKALPNDQGTTVIAELPPSREHDFRLALVPLGAPLPPLDVQTSATPAGNSLRVVQVQIKPPAK